jgi:hypothetical protein
MDLVKKFLHFLMEEYIIKECLRGIEQRLVQDRRFVGFLDMARQFVGIMSLWFWDDFDIRRDPWVQDVWLSYGDVFVDDWSPALYRRIQTLIRHENIERLGSMQLYAALQWRLDRLTHKRLIAERKLAESMADRQQLWDQIQDMVELSRSIRKELTGRKTE